jgi:hypothetical protein
MHAPTHAKKMHTHMKEEKMMINTNLKVIQGGPGGGSQHLRDSHVL